MFYFSTFFSFTKAFKFIPWTDTGLFLLREFRCLGEHVASCLVIRYHVFLTAFCRVSVFIIYSCEGGCTGHLLALFWAHTIKMVLAFLLYNWTNNFFFLYMCNCEWDNCWNICLRSAIFSCQFTHQNTFSFVCKEACPFALMTFLADCNGWTPAVKWNSGHSFYTSVYLCPKRWWEAWIWIRIRKYKHFGKILKSGSMGFGFGSLSSMAFETKSFYA